MLERQQLERQKNDGAWRGELGAMLNRVGQLAISRGERAQRRINGRLYMALDGTWHRQNAWGAGMMMFKDVHGFVSRRIFAYLPALPAYMAGEMTFRNFAASSELTAELIEEISWFINVMPAIAMLRAQCRAADLAGRRGRVACASGSASTRPRASAGSSGGRSSAGRCCRSRACRCAIAVVRAAPS